MDHGEFACPDPERLSGTPTGRNHFEALTETVRMRVVLGVGGAEDSFLALEETVRRTATTGDALTIAILVELATDPDRLERDISEILEPHDLRADIIRIEGDPGPRLTEYADSENFDRIVLGGGRRSPMGKITPGEVAEFVILNAATSVTLVR